jgi:hypothetical protein
MTGRLTLGYRDAVALGDSVPFAAGQRVAGHEFHRCTVTPRAGTAPAWGWRGGEPEGFVSEGVHASFLHTHPAGTPTSVARLARRLLPEACTPGRSSGCCEAARGAVPPPAAPAMLDRNGRRDPGTVPGRAAP